MERKPTDMGSIFVLGLGVLMIIAGGYMCYEKSTSAEEITKKIEENRTTLTAQQAKFAEQRAKMADLTAIMNWAHAPGSSSPENFALILNGWSERLKTVYGIDKFGKVEDGKGPTLQDVVKELEGFAAAKNALADQARKDLKTAQDQITEYLGEWDASTQKVTKKGKIQTLEDEENGKIQALRDQIADLQKKGRDLVSTQEAALKELDRDAYRQQRKITEIKEKASEQQQALSAQVADVQARIEKVKTKTQVVVEEQPLDGRILTAIMDQRMVYLDIGRSTGLFRGTQFAIYRISKGGKREPRGVVVVRDIYMDSARADVLALTNSDNPIEPGDYGVSIQFDAKARKTVVLAGHMRRKYATEDFVKILPQFGFTVKDDIGPDTTYLLLGEGFEESPKFKQAQELGVALMRESDLYDLLGLETAPIH